MRSRGTLFAFLLVAGSFALPLAAHATIPFFGPIIPDSINRCALGWGAVIDVINRIIEFLITLAIVFVAPIMIAYSGFLFVVNPVNAGGKEKAKGILLNTVLGIIISLSAWLIVNAVMAVLYNPGSAGETWTSLIGSGGIDPCIKLEKSLNQTVTGSGVTGVSASGGVVYSGAVAQCSSSNLACSPAALQSAGFTQSQANVMSCIAVTESSGIPGTPPYNIAHPGSNSTACGTFQITQTTWNKYATGSCANFSNCTNATCNMQVARTLVEKNGYTDWTCANCNSKATACIQKYSL